MFLIEQDICKSLSLIPRFGLWIYGERGRGKHKPWSLKHISLCAQVDFELTISLRLALNLWRSCYVRILS